MPLQDLNKFILHKTVIGITCLSCGGDLQMLQRRSLWRRLLLFRARKAYSYQCNGCGHRFRMYRQYN